MTALGPSSSASLVRAIRKSVGDSFASIADDIAHGFFEITHNSFALLGLAVVFAVITLTARPDLREAGESRLTAWLLERQEAAIGFTEPGAIDRATAANPKDLPRQQAAVAFWLSKKYNVAPEPLSVLVAEAFEIGQKAKLDPTLILAIMAIESGFNPFAQSPVGAQGLMQVMTKIHHAKYENFGGRLAAFDPVTNLRVGVKVLQECIARAGSVEAGLKFYVGAANMESDGGYAAKVMAEHARLLPWSVAVYPPTVARLCVRPTPSRHPCRSSPRTWACRTTRPAKKLPAWRCPDRYLAPDYGAKRQLRYTRDCARLAIGKSPASEGGCRRGIPLGSAPLGSSNDHSVPPFAWAALVSCTRCHDRDHVLKDCHVRPHHSCGTNRPGTLGCHRC
jgi:hypothetical protein